MGTARSAPVEMHGEEFRQIGYRLVDQIGDFIDTIRQKPVTTDRSPAEISDLIGKKSLPEDGRPAADIVTQAADLLLNYSLLNGHPKFFGYITSSAAPIGALADLLAAAVNPNVGANILSPVATVIEKQVIKWLCEFIGVPASFDGVLVSGGNMANFTAFFAAIQSKVPGSKKVGISRSGKKLLVYCSKATHTWIEKAASLSGLGSDSIRWIPADNNNKMDTVILAQTIQKDKEKGLLPIMVVGTAGDVSTGAIDDLQGIAAVCKQNDCWFHIDGAYGAPAAVLPDQRPLFIGMNDADSIALDPHKWLYSPLEAGCALLKDPNHLIQTYSYHPIYYNFDNETEPATRNFHEYGFQNSRGFRALKVWMILQQAGRSGFAKMIWEDIRLARLLYKLAEKHEDLQAMTQNLSITTLRFCPDGVSETELNSLNELLLNDLQRNGEIFLSNAVINGKYCLRSCIVNFRTSEKDIEEMIEVIVSTGRKISQLVKQV